MSEKLDDFCLNLFKIGCIKFGDFTLKSGRQSAYYIDLRLLISSPLLMDDLCSLLSNEIIRKDVKFDTICGVPYTALPISTLMSVKMNKPMVLRRKEAKSYGTKQLIDGKFKKGNHCIVIEDVISTGSSILETVSDIENVGMVVNDVFAIIDREEGGFQNITNKGYAVHCLFSLSQMLKVLRKAKVINEDVIAVIETQRNAALLPPVPIPDRTTVSYETRLAYSKSPAATKLFSIMSQKQTNLCLAADVTDINELLKLADEVGPYICIFKIHLDIIESYSEKERDELKNMATRHNFMIMEDRKLADIGNTVRMQFNQISKWANLVTVHAIPGFGVLEAIKMAESYHSDFGVFLIAELSCEKNLITPDYTKKTLALAEKYRELVVGFVCQFPTTFSDPGFIQMTPGVILNDTAFDDKLGQQYNSPDVVMGERNADIAVVGRGIIKSSNPAETADKYKTALWNAYLSRIQ